MEDNLKYSLLKLAVASSHELSSQKISFRWNEIAVSLFSILNSFATSLSIYKINEETAYLEEIVVVDFDGPRDGLNTMPVYQLSDRVLLKLRPEEIKTRSYTRLLVPLHHMENIMGLLEISYANSIGTDLIEAIVQMASALSLGVYYNSYHNKAEKHLHLFSSILHINRAIQSCSNIDDLILNFSKLAIEYLKFDRLSIFIQEFNSKNIMHNYCITAQGEVHTIRNIKNIPFDIRDPQPLEDMAGFWIPIRFQENSLGMMLADNIYTLCDISKDSISVLSELSSQLALSIEHIRLINNINRYAQYDDLTGVLNRRMSMEALEHHIAISTRYALPFTLCYIDINNMKSVNDNFGHNVGDEMLKSFTQILKDKVRQNDVIGRVGGDEFIIIFPSCDLISAEMIWDRIVEGFDHFNKITTTQFSLSASHGMIQYKNENEYSPAQFLSLADELMYLEKQSKGPLNVNKSLLL